MSTESVGAHVAEEYEPRHAAPEGALSSAEIRRMRQRFGQGLQPESWTILLQEGEQPHSNPGSGSGEVGSNPGHESEGSGSSPSSGSEEPAGESGLSDAQIQKMHERSAQGLQPESWVVPLSETVRQPESWTISLPEAARQQQPGSWAIPMPEIRRPAPGLAPEEEGDAESLDDILPGIEDRLGEAEEGEIDTGGATAQQEYTIKYKFLDRVKAAWYGAGVAVGSYFSHPEKGNRRRLVALLGVTAVIGVSAVLLADNLDRQDVPEVSPPWPDYPPELPEPKPEPKPTPTQSPASPDPSPDATSTPSPPEESPEPTQTPEDDMRDGTATPQPDKAKPPTAAPDEISPKKSKAPPYYAYPDDLGPDFYHDAHGSTDEGEPSYNNKYTYPEGDYTFPEHGPIGPPYEWTIIADTLSPGEATPVLLEMIERARTRGIQVDIWGDPHSGCWGITSVTVELPDGTRETYYDTYGKLAALQGA